MTHCVFLLLSIFLAFDASQAKLDVVVTPSPVVAKAGETVQLKCLLQNIKLPIELKDISIQWYTRGTQVAEYDKKLVIEKSGLSMSVEALKKGDATLTITNVNHENTGNYRCYVYYAKDHIMKQIVLQVDDPNKPKEEDGTLITTERALNEKVNKVIDWFNKLDVKVDELIKEAKKCVPKP